MHLVTTHENCLERTGSEPASFLRVKASSEWILAVIAEVRVAIITRIRVG